MLEILVFGSKVAGLGLVYPGFWIRKPDSESTGDRTRLIPMGSLDIPVRNCEYPLGDVKRGGMILAMLIFEPRRFYASSPLGNFLEQLLEKNGLTIREACEIAGCSPSVLHGWIQGAYPTGTVIHLKKLCNHYGYTLSEALTGSPDDVDVL